MSDKIISLLKDGPTKNQKAIIEMLENVIAQCREGDVKGFYMVIDRGSENWGEMLCGCESLRMLGILTVMQKQMLDSLIVN